MGVLNKLIQAQDEILQCLEECEHTIGALYSVYSEAYPEMAPFWGGLAEEESKHGRLLKSVRCELRNGSLLSGLDHFRKDSVQHLIDYVKARIAEAETAPPKKKQAVAIALSIESSIIDTRFFDFAKSDGTSFKAVANQLKHETKNHIQLVIDAKLALEKAC